MQRTNPIVEREGWRGMGGEGGREEKRERDEGMNVCTQGHVVCGEESTNTGTIMHLHG